MSTPEQCRQCWGEANAWKKIPLRDVKDFHDLVDLAKPNSRFYGLQD